MTAAFPVSLFLKIINMSIAAGWMILGILLLRLLFQKMPKWISCVLWGFAGIRLAVPFSLESIFSLIPSAETIPETILPGQRPEIRSGITAVDKVANPALATAFSNLAANSSSGMNSPQRILQTASVLWLIGVGLMLFYLIWSWRRLQKRVSTATLFRENIWQSEFVDSPFILGCIRPRIYIPYQINPATLSYVLAHENAHLSRKDYLVKPLAFLLLSIYWFHPLIWVAWLFFCKDIELACDEKVLRHLEPEQKKEYLLTLLHYDSLSAGKKGYPFTACPLAFGETNIKERILRGKVYQKPAFRIVIISVIICAITAVSFLTDPKKVSLRAPEPFCHAWQVEEIVYEAPQYNFGYTTDTAPVYCLTSDYQLLETVNPLSGGNTEQNWITCGSAEETKLNRKNFEGYINNGEAVLYNFSADTIRKENDKAWVVKQKNSDIFYYILSQKNGDCYLAYGYDTKESPNIRWIFRLSVLDFGLPVETLSEYRTKYIGDNSAVGNIIYNLSFPQDMAYRQFALQTDEEPYEVTITFSVSEEVKKRYAQDLAEDLAPLRENACIMFALIENAGLISFKLTDETDSPVIFRFSRSWAEHVTDCDLWEESKSPEQLQALLFKIREQIADEYL